VSVKGQLVVPLRARKMFNISAGDWIEFVNKGGELILRKGQPVDMSLVSTKGQLVIPLRVREVFKVNEGDRIAFVKKGEDLVLRKAQLIIAKPPA